MSIFDGRKAFKPFEYRDAVLFKDAITKSHWIVTKWGSFTSDVQDFHTALLRHEKSAVKNSLLAISQVEVDVKEFWGKFGDRFPKPEFKQVGAVFAANEVNHSDSYSHLLDILGLNDEFDRILQNPVIQGRVDYLQKYLKGASANNNQNFTLTLTLFSIFIENVSLFSQFLIIKSFNKYKNVLKDIDNVVSATFRDEKCHALFGVYIVNQIKKEFPEWFDDDFYQKIYRAAKKAYEAETKIIDWIFEDGELDFLPKSYVYEFTKDRFNQSLKMIGGEPLFETSDRILSNLAWFDEEDKGEIVVDFFHKKSTSYQKYTKPVTAEELF